MERDIILKELKVKNKNISMFQIQLYTTNSYLYTPADLFISIIKM